MPRIAPILSALIALLGCTASIASSRPSEGPVRLGQRAAAAGLTVRPDRVIEDSRCPENVRCVWAGRLVLAATVTGGRWSRRIELTLGKPIPIADGMLALTSALPEKRTDRATRPRDYRFTFAFQGSI